jgi:hypothetical protein
VAHQENIALLAGSPKRVVELPAARTIVITSVMAKQLAVSGGHGLCGREPDCSCVDFTK